jgi:hypothetical protein
VNFGSLSGKKNTAFFETCWKKGGKGGKGGVFFGEVMHCKDWRREYPFTAFSALLGTVFGKCRT